MKVAVVDCSVIALRKDARLLCLIQFWQNFSKVVCCLKNEPKVDLYARLRSFSVIEGLAFHLESLSQNEFENCALIDAQ